MHLYCKCGITRFRASSMFVLTNFVSFKGVILNTFRFKKFIFLSVYNIARKFHVITFANTKLSSILKCQIIRSQSIHYYPASARGIYNIMDVVCPSLCFNSETMKHISTEFGTWKLSEYFNFGPYRSKIICSRLNWNKEWIIVKKKYTPTILQISSRSFM
jgi:hypothetical protein